MIERAVRIARPGEAIASLGVLLPRGFAIEPGVSVRARGTAITHGHVELCAARARPFASEPPPWETAGWEHSIRTENSQAEVVLRAAHARQRAAWIALNGIAHRPGRAELEVSVVCGERVIERAFVIDVRLDQRAFDRENHWFDGLSPWRDCVRALDHRLRSARAQGELLPGDRLSIRAVSLDGARVRLSCCTVPSPQRRAQTSPTLRSIRRNARVGRYATLEVIRESSEQADDASFAVAATRRRDARGEWAVELTVLRSNRALGSTAGAFAQ